MTPMDLVLSNLLTQKQTGVSAEVLGKNLKPWMDASVVSRNCAEAADKGLVVIADGKGKGKRVSIALTPAGAKHLQRTMGIKAPMLWADLQAHWLCRGLKMEPSAVALKAVKTATGLNRAVLLSACGVPFTPGNEKQAVDQVAWKFFGERLKISSSMPASWSTPELQRLLLVAQLHLPAQTSLKVATQALCAAHVGAKAGDPKSLRAALVSKALSQGSTEPSLTGFVKAVQGATAQCGEHFHGQDVLIVHVWNAYRKHATATENLDNFKNRLVEANQQGMVQLSRADLAHLFNRTDITASEIRVRGAAFHFIRHGGRL